MRLFSEATLLKMEIFCTQRRKKPEREFISPWRVWLNPSLLLKPHENYTLKDYLRVSGISAAHTTVHICFALCIGVVLGIRLFPDFWRLIRNPKYHALIIGFLSKEGVYNIPFALLFFVLFTLALRWPRYYFWNRRAKRLQREGYVEVPFVAAAELPNDVTVWPPAPRPMK